MSNEKTKELLKKRKVGKYTINFIIINPNSNYNKKYIIEVRKGNKIISKTNENNIMRDAEEKYKEVIEEYKLKAIKEGNYKFISSDFEIKPKTTDGYIMQKINKYTNKIVDEDCKISTFEGLIRAFIHNKTNKKSVVGNYKIEKDKLIYVDVNNKEQIDTLVLRLKNKLLLGNASKLKYCGWCSRGDEAPAQRIMFDMNIPLVPFNVFEEANLDIQKSKVIEQGKEEDFILPKLEWDSNEAILKPVSIYDYVDRKRKQPKIKNYMKVTSKEKIKNYDWIRDKKRYYTTHRINYIDKRQLAKRHFVGAMLLKVNKKYFLFDIDRNEIKHYRFNPFLVELPKPCKTIEQAYDMLKPLEVKQAEKKGVKVLRQGEWFFIPTKKKIREKQKPLPKVIKKGIDNKPDKEEFDLTYYGVHSNRLVDNYTIKELCRKIKLKYRNHLKQRIADYNKEISKYLKFVKQKEDFENSFNFFDYGGELKAGDNRPNSVDKLFIENGIHYAKGRVEHTGREHEPITLKSWYKAIPNTAIKSFTITGNID